MDVRFSHPPALLETAETTRREHNQRTPCLHVLHKEETPNLNTVIAPSPRFPGALDVTSIPSCKLFRLRFKIHRINNLRCSMSMPCNDAAILPRAQPRPHDASNSPEALQRAGSAARTRRMRTRHSVVYSFEINPMSIPRLGRSLFARSHCRSTYQLRHQAAPPT